MGMRNIEGYGQFRKMDKRSVLGTLKATGSRAPDVLLLQKQKLLPPNKSSRFADLCLAVLGALLSLIIVGAPREAGGRPIAYSNLGNAQCAP